MRFYRFILHKSYFDKGFSLLNYFKYFVALVGFKFLSVKQIILTGIIYGIVCYMIGFVWFKLRIVDSELEVNNQYNPFVDEVRRKLK